MCQHLCDFSKMTKAGTTAPSVLWAPMAPALSSNPPLCLHLFLTAGSSFSLVSRHESQETLQLKTHSGIKTTKHLKEVCASLIQPPYSAESLFTLSLPV